MLRLTALALFAVLLAATPVSSRTPAVFVVALYRERMLLPAGAALHVQLTDATTGHVLATAMLDNPHVPVYLDLAYEPSNVDAEHTYTIAARILVDGEPFFATKTPAKVITHGNPSHVQLVLYRVTESSPALLEHRQWTLTELQGHAVTVQHRPFLELSAGRASGSGGCNRFSGGYTLHGDAIQFTHTAITMMACIQENVMETESAFTKALSSVRYWKVEGPDLELLDGAHKPLMRLRNP